MYYAFLTGSRKHCRFMRPLNKKFFPSWTVSGWKAQKTQIAFANRHNFAFVSFLPVRKANDRPEVYIVVTFGLGYRAKSPRIDAAVEPYPGRWTYHVLISEIGEIDDELMGWVKEAAVFSSGKR